MNQNDILNGLADILFEVAEVDPASVALDSTLDGDLDIDSLLMVEVTVAAEEKFGVVIADEDLSTFKTVGDLVRHISQQFALA